MPKLHEYLGQDVDLLNLPADLAWKASAYEALSLQLNTSHRLLLQKLVSELEDEAATVTIAHAPLDLSRLTTNLDYLQTDTDQPQD